MKPWQRLVCCWPTAILAIGALAATTSISAQRSSSAVSAASPPAVVARGTVRSAGGHVIAGAVVRATQFAGKLIALTTSDADGRFLLALPARVLIGLEVEAPLSRSAHGGVFVTPDMGDLVVTLGGSRPTIDSTTGPRIVLLAGRVLDTANTASMTRLSDGRWQANIPSDRERVRYRIRYGRGTNTNTPDAGRIENITDDVDVPDFVSVAPVTDGEATIVLDPSRLPKDTAQSGITVTNRLSTSARLEAVRAVTEEYFRTVMAVKRGDTAAIRIATEPIVRRTVRALALERNPIVRQAYANTLGSMFWPHLSVGEAQRVRRVLDPRSPVAADYGYPIALSGVLIAEEFRDRRGKQLSGDTIYSRRLREVAGAALDTPGISRWMRGRLYWQLAYSLGSDSLTQSIGLAYADSLAALPETSEQEVRMLLREISPSRPTQVGKPIVSWVAADLDNPTKQLRAEDFAGKWTLIDLWGPWCAPCVAEMPALHDAHKLFSVRGLHIVSIDFDRSPDPARDFRKERYPMPWSNAYAGEEMFESPAARLFSTAKFPTIILVNPEGKIVAMDAPLRGARLAETLDRLLPKAPTTVP
jgi:thiol-disulfide isomerase/thioredoxin